MYLSDICIRRPVFTTVLMILLLVFGAISYNKIPLREYPNIDPPVVTVSTFYPGASANVVESNVTEILESRISGVEGIKSITSSSEDGRSKITIEFNISQNIDDATNDVRDRVSSIVDSLPREVDYPEIQKTNSDDDVILWLNLTSENLSVMELTDYADRYLVDKFSVIDGVARVRIGGAKEKALRVWLDRAAMVSFNVTTNDIEDALRQQNIELPAGTIETESKSFTVKVERLQKSINDFKTLVLRKGDSGYIVRLSDVARIDLGPKQDKGFFRGNSIPMVGLGIIKQSNANTIEVSDSVNSELKKISNTLPEGMSIENSYDSSIFIKKSLKEVYKTLLIAVLLVVIVMLFFLRSLRAMLIPATTIPICIVSCFTGLYFMGYTINLLTTLAMVLAIGLIVDDAIVVVENIYRKFEKSRDGRKSASQGVSQVSFAVIATTLVLISVFAPIIFLTDYVGRLFSEFAATIIITVVISTFVSLTLIPMLSSRLIGVPNNPLHCLSSSKSKFHLVTSYYKKLLMFCIKYYWMPILFLSLSFIASYYLFAKSEKELVPKEDRGVIFFFINGPEGSSEEYMTEYVDEIEKRLMPFTKTGEFKRLLLRLPRSFGATTSYNSAIGIIVLDDFGNRKPTSYYIGQIRSLTKDLTGVQVFPIARQGLVKKLGKPVQFVLQGPDYKTIAGWRDILFNSLKKDGRLVDLDSNYKENKPYMVIEVDKNIAGDLGVSFENLSRTLETMLGSKKVTSYIQDGKQYDVILEQDDLTESTTFHLGQIYVRSETSNKLIPIESIITQSEQGFSKQLNRYNKLRSITIEAGLGPDIQLGEALSLLESKVKELLPSGTLYDYQGQSKSFKDAEKSIYFTFALSLLIVYLVMAAQFESFKFPFVIMLTVPFAVLGGLIGVVVFDQSLNIYSEIAMIMLVGIATKNGILIVEFINQLRKSGKTLLDSVLEASCIRLRPIVMTSITTIASTIPLIMSSGAGAESRISIGITLVVGLAVSLLVTIFIIPTLYYIIEKSLGSICMNIKDFYKL